MIEISNGLKHSLIVLEHLRNDEDLRDIDIVVGTFTNCRERGLTFTVWSSKGKEFTWCVYEHRNSDDIIINGREGYVSMNGDLPYQGERSGEYLAKFRYNQHFEAADQLSAFIVEFNNAE